MNRAELRETLLALIDGLRAPSGSGVVITEAEIELPLEVTSAMRGGKLVFFCSAPHTRWVSGVLPPLHLGKLRVELAEAGCAE
jgi:hypothetical protein